MQHGLKLRHANLKNGLHALIFWRELRWTNVKESKAFHPELHQNLELSPSKSIIDFLLTSELHHKTLFKTILFNLNLFSPESAFNKMKHLKDQTNLNCEGTLPKKTKLESKNITVSIEGNIGSGKSTLLKHFEKLPYCEVVGEPLERLTDLDGHNPLALLYEDHERWSFSFNMFAQLNRIGMHLKPHTCPIKMLERSLYSTRYCFVQNDLMNKTINGFEFSVFCQWFDYLTSNGRANVDLIVYLRADPSVCFDRMRKRSRAEEAGVPKSLIDSLHKLHDDWLLEKKYPVPAPVLVLDANHDLEKMLEVYDSRQQEILCGYNAV